MTIGIVTMTVAAEISPQGTENSLVYIEIPTGTVRHLSSLLIVKANKYSFQAAIKARIPVVNTDRKSTRLNSSHVSTSYAVFCLNKKKYQDSHCDHLPATL